MAKIETPVLTPELQKMIAEQVAAGIAAEKTRIEAERAAERKAAAERIEAERKAAALGKLKVLASDASDALKRIEAEIKGGDPARVCTALRALGNIAQNARNAGEKMGVFTPGKRGRPAAV